MSKYDASPQSLRDKLRRAKDLESGERNDPVKKTGHYAEAPHNVAYPGDEKYRSKFAPENKTGYKNLAHKEASRKE